MADGGDPGTSEGSEAAREAIEGLQAGLEAVVGALRDATAAAEMVFWGSGDESGVLTLLGRLDALIEELGTTGDDSGAGD